MKKYLIAAAVAAIAAVPAVTGLVGNASFAQSVPVQVPAGARTIDDHGHHAQPGDDRGRHAEPGDDRGRHAEPGDDHGGASSQVAPITTPGPDDGLASGSATVDDGGSRHGGHDDGPAGR
jgi:hypothetical protein